MPTYPIATVLLLSLLSIPLLFADVSQPIQDSFARQAEENVNTADSKIVERRRSAHTFLFEKFIRDKKCTYSEDRKVLKEVLLLDKKTDVEQSAVFQLPEGTHQIAGFFSHIFLTGDNLSQDLSLMYEFKGRQIELHQDFRLNDKIGFRLKDMHGWNELEGDSVVELKVNKKVVIEKVILVSKYKMTAEFDPDSFVEIGQMDAKDRRNFVFMYNTQRRSFEELALRLMENTEAVGAIVLMASVSAGLEPPVEMRSVLADRRVAKIFEGLSSLPPEDAATKAESYFDLAFEQLEPLRGSDSFFAANITHGINAHLFLCNEFCNPEVSLEKISKWRSYAFETGTHFAPMGKNSSLYLINLYANLMSGLKGYSVKESEAWVREAMNPIAGKFPGFDLKPLQVHDWSKEADGKDGFLAVVPVIETWSGTNLETADAALIQGTLLAMEKKILEEIKLQESK